VPGPEAFTTTDFANGTAGSLGGKLVVPNAPGKYPLLVNTHGFSGNASQQLGWAEHYASYGFICVVPSMGGTDHKASGDVIKALVDLYTNPATASPAQGKVDAARVGLSGHSAGGLQTVFAAAQVKPRATVLFDPVDSQGIGKPVYATLCGPVMGIFAEPGACNVQAEWSTFKTTTVGPQVMLKVPGSNHCDPINPSIGALCDIACGGAASAANQAHYSQYSTAFFLANLKDDAAASAILTPSALAADTTITDTSTKDAPNCALTPNDGGTSADAGPIDGSMPPQDGPSSPPDGMSSDSMTTPDAKGDTSSSPDAPRADATLDSSSEPDVSEPPVSDAGTSVLDSSIDPPKDSGSAGAGGSGGTGTGGASTAPAQSNSGCGCSLAKNETAHSWGAVTSLLFGMAVTARRVRRRTRA
jgi:dienelactone hydrolase